MKYKAVYRCIVAESNHLFSVLLVTFYASMHQRIVHFTTRSVIHTQYCFFFLCPYSFFVTISAGSVRDARSCSKNLLAKFPCIRSWQKIFVFTWLHVAASTDTCDSVLSAW